MTTRRHPTVEQLCDLLAKIVHGRAANELLKAGEHTGAHALVELPVWAWALATANVGRKDRDSDGSRMLLPVRITYNLGPLVVLTGDQAQVSYTGAGLGNQTSGSMTASTDAPLAKWADGDLQAPPEWGPSAFGQRAVRARLDELARLGHEAEWALLGLLEGRADRLIHRALASLRNGRMTTGAGEDLLLHDTSVEAVRTRLVYGDPGDGPSAVQRLIERCTAPATFASCDPEHYISVSLRRDAKYAVQKALGDPHVGPKVRALYNKLGPGTDILSELVPEYNRRYPSDRLGAARAMEAMAIVSDPMATSVAIEEHHHATFRGPGEYTDPEMAAIRRLHSRAHRDAA